MAGPSGETPLLEIPFPIDNDNVDVVRDMEAMAQKMEALLEQLQPIGATQMWLAGAAPAGWLFLDGTQQDAAVFPRLAAKFPAWVAAGQITLPNFQERVPMGPGGGAALLELIGATQIALAVGQLPAHKHVLTDPTHNHADTFAVASGGAHVHGAAIAGNEFIIVDRPTAGEWCQMPVGTNHAPRSLIGENLTAPLVRSEIATASAGAHAHTLNGANLGAATGITMQDTGGGANIDIRQKSVVVNFIIRAL